MSDRKTILLVDDDKDDVFFFQYALETAGVDNPLQIAVNGQQAIDYLAGTGQYADRVKFPLPGLVLLDLKLPIKTGLDVLRWVQTQPHLAGVVVVVLTSSSEPVDVESAYALGARSYLIKPAALEKRVDMVRKLRDYWLEMNRFPTLPGPPPKPGR
jgi:two-component system response regulator